MENPVPPAATGRVRYLDVRQDSGQRVDNFLLRELRGLPKSRIYRMLRSGEVRVNGARVKPSHRLQDGDRVRVPPVHGLDAEGASADTAFISAELLAGLEPRILHEDEELLILDKPAGMPVHGGSGLSFGAIEILRRMRPDADLGLAHRLDRDTSGCLLVAKSRRVLLELHRVLREREIRKRYLVIVQGRWPRRTTTVRLPLERYLTASGERRVRVAAAGKPSRTDFGILAAHDAATLLEARLHTGRTHQIRVHCLASGHAVVGDPKYPGVEPVRASGEALPVQPGIHRLCLHAEQLVLNHQGRKLRVVAAPPDDFRNAWRALTGSPFPERAAEHSAAEPSVDGG